jgi:hypothetical protein
MPSSGNLADRVKQQVLFICLDEARAAHGLLNHQLPIEQSIYLAHRGWQAGAGKFGEVTDRE